MQPIIGPIIATLGAERVLKIEDQTGGITVIPTHQGALIAPCGWKSATLSTQVGACLAIELHDLALLLS